MTDTEALRETPLHDLHVRAGARMVAFAGWHLPVQFRGVIAEHLAVRAACGLFDVSHMGEALVQGPAALELLQYVTCNDVARLRPGRAQYTALTTPEGTFVDDLLVYCLADDAFLLVLNAANTAKDVAWLESHATGRDVVVTDSSAEWAQLAVQGPRALAVVRPLVASSLDELKAFRFVRADVCGAPSIVSRTGYTGEDGFELYTPPASAPGIWKALLDGGAQHGLTPVGLAARDTLRLEARLTLYGNDIDATTTVVEAGLAWIVKPQKGAFLGRDILAHQLEHGVQRKLVGFEMRGRAIARQGYRVVCEDRAVGHVTSGTHSPTLKKNIGLAYVPVELAEVGREFQVEIRRRIEPAVVVPTPFYKRPKQSG